MKLQPLGNRVVVEPMSSEESTKSGIIIPDTIDKEKKAEGKIIAIGDGEKILKLNLTIGDRVLFGKYSGTEIKIDSEEHLILREEDILAVIN